MEPPSKKLKVTNATGSDVNGPEALINQNPLKTDDGETRHSAEIHPDLMLHTKEDQGLELHVDTMSTILAAILQQTEDINQTSKMDNKCPSDMSDIAHETDQPHGKDDHHQVRVIFRTNNLC